jgi:hypothetical protein
MAQKQAATAYHEPVEAFDAEGNIKPLFTIAGMEPVRQDGDGSWQFQLSGVKRIDRDWQALREAAGYNEIPDDFWERMADKLERLMLREELIQVLAERCKHV